MTHKQSERIVSHCNHCKSRRTVPCLSRFVHRETSRVEAARKSEHSSKLLASEAARRSLNGNRALVEAIDLRLLARGHAEVIAEAENGAEHSAGYDLLLHVAERGVEHSEQAQHAGYSEDKLIRRRLITLLGDKSRG